MSTTRVAPPSSVARRSGRALGLLPAALVLLVLVLISVGLGSRDVAPADVWQALIGSTDRADATVIREMRMPRTLIALVVGAALALGGTILQGLARNPLADPGVLGINAGAALAVVAGALVFGAMPASAAVWFAFAGAALATVAVYTIAAVGREGATPVKLALAGAAATALCGSFSSAILLADPDALNELRMWQVGALAGRYYPVLVQLAPYFAVGIVAALFTGRALNLLSLGDELASTLGLRIDRTRGVLFAIVALLCGAATAACGPIVFVGLMIPHLARLITGPDYRWILAYSTVLGPVLLLGSDILGRVLLPTAEVPVGVVVGVLGAPVFVLLVRFRRIVTI
ncbi:iron ABC transporter permease [Occultella glacieicola]|uniref:Iron ABC transporter permease n=1 Tax=Occultella glacieicola TaxID=2518684 RepID=A0ABY2E7D4_9MICO|nr:iron ABC transporter permease [Occultella glacieicola]TDE97338.1 iron ABC transporter permease [Occultella glacieicola]